MLAAVAAGGSLAHAAKELHITPSGVSQQMAKLERESGHVLLEPCGRGVRLTHAGQVLAEHASAVMRVVATAEADLADLRTEAVGPLRVGAVGTALRAITIGALTELADSHPRLVPTVRDGEGIELLPALAAGDLDVVLIDSWRGRPPRLPRGMSTRVLASERIDIALAAAHPAADSDTIRLDRLADDVWASCPPGSEPHEALLALSREYGMEPEIRYTVSEYSTQLDLVAAGLAVALVPEIAQRDTPAGVRFVRSASPVRREVKAVWRTHTAGPPVRACLAAFGSQVRSSAWGR